MKNLTSNFRANLHISKYYSIQIPGHRPNIWYRLWQWLLLGWKWEQLND